MVTKEECQKTIQRFKKEIGKNEDKLKVVEKDISDNVRELDKTEINIRFQKARIERAKQIEDEGLEERAKSALESLEYKRDDIQRTINFLESREDEINEKLEILKKELDEWEEKCKIVWRPFLQNLLISCESPKHRKKYKSNRQLEVRGKFEAPRDLVIPTLKIDTEVETYLTNWVNTTDYDVLLSSCEGDLSTELTGFDALREEDDIIVEDEDKKETRIELELYDYNYNKIRASQVKTEKGRWWE